MVHTIIEFYCPLRLKEEKKQKIMHTTAGKAERMNSHKLETKMYNEE